PVSCIGPLGPEKLVAAGVFNQFNSTSTEGLVLLSQTDELISVLHDSHFSAGSCQTALPMKDGPLIVVSTFGVERLHPAGGFDVGFRATVGRTLRDLDAIDLTTVASLPDGGLAIAGHFTWENAHYPIVVLGRGGDLRRDVTAQIAGGLRTFG